MAKTKINYKNANVTVDCADIIVEELDQETGEVIDTVVLGDMVKYMLEENNNANLNVSIKPYKEPKPKERKPRYSYSCPSCGKEFICNSGDLNIICADCDEEFFCEEV